MNLKIQNQIALKKHQRRLIQKIYNSSKINRQYVFPKSSSKSLLSTQSQMSLLSQISQQYNLHSQNKSSQPIFSNIYNKILSIQQILKYKQSKKTENRHIQGSVIKQPITQSRVNSSKKSRKGLSLTPSKNKQEKTYCNSEQKQKYNRLNPQRLNKVQLITKEKQQTEMLQLKRQKYMQFDNVSECCLIATNAIKTIFSQLQKQQESQVQFHSNTKPKMNNVYTNDYAGQSIVKDKKLACWGRIARIK